MRQPRHEALQFLLFAGVFQVGFVQFVEQIPVVILCACKFTPAGGEFLQFFLQGVVLFVPLPVLCPRYIVPGVTVDQSQAESRAGEQQALVLGMHVEQVSGEPAEGVEQHGGIVDKGAGFSGGEDLPTQDGQRFVVQVVFGKEAFQTHSVDFDREFHHAFAGVVAQGGQVGSRPRRQSQSAQYDGFSRAGLAREDSHARRGFHLQAVDQRIVGNVQFFYHRSVAGQCFPPFKDSVLLSNACSVAVFSVARKGKRAGICL